jgi:hypothetical protein
MGDKDPRQLKVGELVDKARQAGIKGAEHMNKDEILRAVSGHFKGKPGQGGRHSAQPKNKSANQS